MYPAYFFFFRACMYFSVCWICDIPQAQNTDLNKDRPFVIPKKGMGSRRVIYPFPVESKEPILGVLFFCFVLPSWELIDEIFCMNFK